MTSQTAQQKTGSVIYVEEKSISPEYVHRSGQVSQVEIQEDLTVGRY